MRYLYFVNWIWMNFRAWSKLSFLFFLLCRPVCDWSSYNDSPNRWHDQACQGRKPKWGLGFYMGECRRWFLMNNVVMSAGSCVIHGTAIVCIEGARLVMILFSCFINQFCLVFVDRSHLKKSCFLCTILYSRCSDVVLYHLSFRGNGTLFLGMRMLIFLLLFFFFPVFGKR